MVPERSSRRRRTVAGVTLLPSFRLILVFATAVGCGSEPRPSRPVAEAIELAPHAILADSAVFGLPTLMKVVGDRLLVADAQDTLWMTVIDRSSGEIENRFGRVGDGPNEIRTAWFMFVEMVEPPQVWTFDLMTARFTRWSLTASATEAALESHVYLGPIAPMSRPLLTEEGVVTADLESGSVVLVTDGAGRSIRSRLGVAPFVPDSFPPDRPVAHYTANEFLPVASPSRRRLALFYKHLERVDFVDLDSGDLRVIEVGTSLPRPEVHPEDRARWNALPDVYASGQDATEQHAYSVYCGCTLEDRRAGVRPTTVRVFTWTGDHLMDIDLGRYVTAIAVSPDNTTLYGAIQEPAPMIAVWRLPERLHSSGSAP